MEYKNMTYRELAEWIGKLTPEQQDLEVMVFANEFMPLLGVSITDEDNPPPDDSGEIGSLYPYLMTD